jgi:hypothetical protein
MIPTMIGQLTCANVATIPVGSTRVSRVQFGVPPNCRGARATAFRRVNTSNLCPSSVSGVTPETTRRRRVLPTASGHMK